MNFAERAASTMSQLNARLAPAPAATPFTAQTTGAQAADAADQRVVPSVQRRAEVGRGVAFADHPVSQVLPGAEAASGAGQQHGADRGIGLDAIERPRQLCMHRLVEDVELVRPIEREHRHAIGGLVEDGGFGHSSAPFAAQCGREI